jgi:hypothetical protein
MCFVWFSEQTAIISLYSIKWVAARSKAWYCGHSLAEIVGSNLAGCIDVCPL